MQPNNIIITLLTIIMEVCMKKLQLLKYIMTITLVTIPTMKIDGMHWFSGKTSPQPRPESKEPEPTNFLVRIDQHLQRPTEEPAQIAQKDQSLSQPIEQMNQIVRIKQPQSPEIIESTGQLINLDENIAQGLYVDTQISSQDTPLQSPQQIKSLGIANKAAKKTYDTLQSSAETMEAASRAAARTFNPQARAQHIQNVVIPRMQKQIAQFNKNIAQRKIELMMDKNSLKSSQESLEGRLILQNGIKQNEQIIANLEAQKTSLESQLNDVRAKLSPLTSPTASNSLQPRPALQRSPRRGKIFTFDNQETSDQLSPDTNAGASL